MEFNNIKKEKIVNTLLEYIIALLIVLNANSVYSHLANIDFHFNILILIFLIIYIIFRFFTTKDKSKIKIKIFYKYFFIYVAYMVIFAIFNKVRDKSFINNFLLIFPIFVFIFLNFKDTIKNIFAKIVDVVVIISIVSLVLYFLFSVIKAFDLKQSVVIDWGNVYKIKSFYHIYFETQSFHGFGLNICRNTGIFVEAPMYSLILTIALAMESFIIKRKKMFIYLILSFSVLTTFSTTGIIAMSLIYVLNFISILVKKQKISKKAKRIMFIIGGILITISLIYFIQRINTESGSIRLDDYKASFKAWLDYPIFGNGYLNSDCIKAYMSSFRIHNMGLSNSFAVLLAQCGIYLFIFYLIPLIYLGKKWIDNKEYEYLFFSLVIVLLFITTIFMYKPIMILIMASGYSQIIKKEGDNNFEKITN